MKKKFKRASFLFMFVAPWLASTSALAGIKNEPVPGRSCKPSGQEQYYIQVDGAPMGGFSETAPPAVKPDSTGGSVILRNGVFLPGSFLKEWVKFNQLHTKSSREKTEKHDIGVFEKASGGKLGKPVFELIDTYVSEIEAVISDDNPNCLIIDHLELHYEKLQNPSGVGAQSE